MSAGDKDRSGFHRVGGSLTQGRSHVSTQEHEHCIANMLTDTPGIKCRAADLVGSCLGSGFWENGFWCAAAAARDCFVATLLAMTAQRIPWREGVMKTTYRAS